MRCQTVLGHADECALQDLPLHVLHKITSDFDPSSQRSLFLSSSRLYKRWLIQIPDQERHWQFVQQSISVLADTTLAGCCTPDSNISIHSEAQVPWGRISCQQQQQGVQFGLAHSTKAFPDGDYQPDYTGISQAQLWHRLTAIHELAFATVTLKSAPHATPHELVTFAKRCFNLLCNARGVLTLYMEGLEESCEKLHDERERGRHALKISHATRLFNFGSSNNLSSVNQEEDYWQVDAEYCIVLSPNLDFDNMPAEVTRVHAQIMSQGPPDQPHLSPDVPKKFFYPDRRVVFSPYNKVLRAFAYKGNIDLRSWV